VVVVVVVVGGRVVVVLVVVVVEVVVVVVFLPPPWVGPFAAAGAAVARTSASMANAMVTTGTGNLRSIVPCVLSRAGGEIRADGEQAAA
jgi:hypothetical protein